MIFRFLAICILSLWGGLLAAQSDPAPIQDSATDLRQAIEQTNFDRVEQILASAHEKLRQGAETPDQLRNRFGVFGTANPDVIEFVSTWRARNPDSIYAKTAQAWVFYAIGSNVRGVEFTRNTYPVAMEIHRNMFFDAQDLAMQVYAKDNTLLSAADALIVLSRFIGTQDIGLEALDQVMQDYPNWGSLTRALDMSNPQYGGSVELADALCEYYAPLIPENGVNMVHACFTWASFVYHGHRRDEIRQWMRESDSSWYDRYRVQDMFRRRPASDDEIALAVKFFRDGKTTNLRLARKFDLYYGHQNGIEPVEHIVLERAKTWARGVLEHDPYNLGALKTLLISSFDVTVQASGGIVMTPTGSPTDDEERDYLRRRVLAAPYNAKFWESLAKTLGWDNSDLTVEKILAAADMRANAIAYSNQSPEAVVSFIYQKLWEMEQLDAWEEAAGVRLQQDLDYQKVYACPLIRSLRLIEPVLESGEPIPKYSKVSEETQAQLAEIRTVAETGGDCDWERTAPLEDLIFEPVEVDLSIIN